MAGRPTRFWKYHGLGNDFIIMDRRETGDLSAESVRKVCDRHRGVGADGILAALTGDDGQLFMRVFNADGSLADMCGNGLRCFVRWAVDVLGVPKEDSIAIGSDAGEQICRLIPQEEPAQPLVEVNLGDAQFHGEQTISIDGRAFTGEVLFLGNPHFVLRGPPQEDDVAVFGPRISTHPSFPNGTNVEWLDVQSPNHASVLVWERGVGPTQACGTGGAGACAVGVRWQTLEAEATVTVIQPGGALTYRVASDFSSVWMCGPAVPIYTGAVTLELQS
jgi:diaminopimelate epimerase